jgi:hypothetical protein
MSLLVQGCGGANTDAISDLEEQREVVLLWARELAASTEDTLNAPPEETRESYEGVDKSGLTERATSFHYEVQTDFQTEQPDPLATLSQELSEYGPQLDGVTLSLKNDDMTAIFRTFPEAAGAVNLLVYGPAVEIDEDDMADWEGWVIGEPVDLE